MKTILNMFAALKRAGRKSVNVALKLALIFSAVLIAGSAGAQTSFYTPEVIVGDYGSVTNDNSSIVPDIGAPTIANLPPSFTAWYQWTPTNSGEVVFDTIVDNSTGFSQLDTVIGAYTGTNLTALNLVAANDDAFPQSGFIASLYNRQFFYAFGDTNYFFSTNAPPFGGYNFSPYFLPTAGPSILRFNAIAGQTYYIAVDSRNSGGENSLNWALHPAGVFRFATENIDSTFSLPLYQGAATESTSPRWAAGVRNFSPLGILVTITRVAGSSGRVSVDYATEDVDYAADANGFLFNGDLAGLAGTDYVSTTGTLTFDDYEMSKTISIPVLNSTTPKPNRVFGIYLTNSAVDPLESSDVAPPRVDYNWGYALVRILDVNVDPKGATMLSVTNLPPGNTNLTPIYSTRPTNSVFNFQKANYQVYRAGTGLPFQIYVNRTGTNRTSDSVLFSVNSSFPYDKADTFKINEDNQFPLTPGSDYATPQPINSTFVKDKVADFNFPGGYSGSLSWGNNDSQPKAISFTALRNNLSQFNEDFQIHLYKLDSDGNPYPVGMVSDCTVTILPCNEIEDARPGSVVNLINAPAGSVDEVYNADFGSDFFINTVPPDMVHPGTDGQVFGMAVQADDKAILVGDYFSYNGTSRGSIARVTTNGYLDTTYNIGSGANDFVSCVGLDASSRALIGGNFTSINGTQRNGIARLTTTGSLDNTFNPGAGVDGTIWALKVLSSGKIIIAGDFNTYNGVPRQSLALLNADGTLDTTFQPGSALNGPVYAIGVEGDTRLDINRTAVGTDLEDVFPINVGSSSGTLTVNYDFVAVPDNMRVFYGGTNDVKIFDSGLVNGSATVVIPFAPTNGLTTNVITIVMNQGNGVFGTFWLYDAVVIASGANQFTVGGDFTSVSGVVGQDRLTRILSDGSVDGTFNPGGGVNGPVYAITVQSSGKLVIGGEFSQVNGLPQTRIARLSSSGILDTTFYTGIGADDTVYSLDARPDDSIYIGGAFISYNGTHRLGFARLNADGTVDTSFMDTAYNQFAGLSRQRYGDSHGTVLTSALQSNGGVLIGGSFSQVGGGEFDPRIRADSNTNAYPQFITRSTVRNKNNFARLLGGGTPGPGNLGFNVDTYSVNKSSASLFVDIIRTNGFLGNGSANFSVLSGLAQSGTDYLYIGDNNGNSVYYPSEWSATRMHSDALFGQNAVADDDFGAVFAGFNSLAVNIALTGNTNNLSDLSTRIQLANPSGADQFFLGGMNIPLGLALGASTAPLNLIEDRHQSGVFSYAAAVYAGSSNTPVAINRASGNYGVCSVQYATTTNGSTAILNSDYRAASGTLGFSAGQTNAFFTLQVLQSNYVSTVEKSVNLRLFNAQGPANGLVSLGLTNAVFRIINGNFQGYVNIATNNYATNLSAGSIALTVTRTVGNKGLATVQFYSVNGTAVSGTDFIGFTNTLSWNNGDVSPRTVIVPLVNTGLLGGSKQFSVKVGSPTLNGLATPSLFAATGITNATVTINNDTTFGTYQFSQPVYHVNENGGAATMTVTRRNSTNGSVTLDYTTFDGGAVSNLNYGQTAGQVTFAPGQLSALINVPIINDLIINPAPAAFNLTVGLTAISSGGVIGLPSLAEVQIEDASSYVRPPGDPDVAFDDGSGMNATVLALALQSGGGILAGGNFTGVNGTPRNYFARLNPDGTLDSTGFLNGLSGANGSVSALANQTDNRVVLGGNFTTINGIVRNRIARVLMDGSLDTSFNPGAGADNSVYAVAETFVGSARKIYVGGAFNIINAVASRSIVRLNENGTVDGGFNVGAGAGGTVYAVAVYPQDSVLAGKVVIGGDFLSYNNVSLPRIARLNADGALDTNFSLTLSADGAVRAIAIQTDGKVIIGGDFTHVNGAPANHIARLNLDGSIDALFMVNLNGGFDDSVLSIVLQADNRIMVGGDFNVGNGVTRHRLTRLMPDGKVDPTINFGQGLNAAAHAMVIQPNDGMIVVGGAFTKYDDQFHQRIVRIYGNSQTGSGEFLFTSPTYTADENGIFASINVRRKGGTMGSNLDGSGDVTVHFETTDGTAIAGINYSNVSTDLVFPPAETFQAVRVPLIQDFVVTPTLTNLMTLSSPLAPATLGDQLEATLFIVNDDAAVSFSSPNYTVSKNTLTGFGSVIVSRIGSTFGTASVDLINTTNGTAVVGVDYFPTNTTVVFNPGESSKTINVPVINNGLPQGNTTVFFTLSNAVNALMYEPSNTVLTIIDTVNSPGQLAFAAPTYVVGEGGTNARITVIRTNGQSGNVSVNYATVANTAIPGVNYLTTVGTLSFGDGILTREIVVPLVDNNAVQGSVTFTVALSSPGGGATVISPTNTIVTILDNDTAFAFAAATNLAPENLSFASISVLRLYNTNDAVTVNYATADGSAIHDVNYTTTAGTLTFTNGETIKSISIPLLNVTNVTGDLQFTVGLASPSAGTQLTSPSNTVIVLQDADAGISFTNTVFSVLKNAGFANITVVCSNPRVEPVVLTTNDIPLSVGYFTVDGSAKAGVDYQAVSGTLVFTNGTATNELTIPIYNNSIVNGNHNFTVVLTNVTAPGQITPYGTQTVVIEESNSGLRFSQSGYTVFKSGVQANINVFRTGYTNSLVSVDYFVTNGTAVNGVNFIATNGTLVFSNGVTTRSFGIPIIANSQVQPNLSALMQLVNPINGFLVSPNTATLTILEDNGSYVIPAGAQLIAESGAGAPNGILDSNETVTVLFAFRDSAGLNVTNLVANLLATNGVLSPSPASQSYSNLTVYGHSASRPFSFVVNGTNALPISPTFKLYDNAKFIGTAAFGFTVGAWTTSFTNTNTITINDNTNASPYPSVISVSGLGVSLIKSVVILNRLTHIYPADVAALVLSPVGSNTLIMANTGGGLAITNVVLTFDDAATNSLPQSSRIITGTNKPTGFFPVLPFP